ncbi:integrin-linked protein kinase homolog pat-4-like [Penaeus monodon]|uniref:integrin-linked protein kinase homolog pat-4-like n=1 Tax=Penaeus monodon TaxID=6687 RepID=UPI0018A6E657|nr:integrin-linked protein kinase homolog pat-4-like [Penaeus monodon]
MEDIFHWCREGNTVQVRLWLDDTEHDMNQGDDHGFSLLHWAAKEGHLGIVEMLITRGARINATNLGDDHPIHLAAAHGHRDIVSFLIRHKADVNFINEHGNTPLHYACFWGYQLIAEDLVQAGASVSIANKYGEVPLDKCKGAMAKKLHSLAVDCGQNLEKVAFKDQSWLGLKTRSRDPTLSRHKGININELSLHTKIAISPSGEMWRGKWQGNEIVAKILALRECSPRVCRDFNEEFPRLRIFSHPNVLPVVGCSNSPPNLVVITQYLHNGSLYQLLHQETSVVVDTAQALKFALDIARGMAFIHSLEKLVPNLYLSSKHIMVNNVLFGVNRLLADSWHGFQKKKEIFPKWFYTTALQKKPKDLNVKAADMWSFAVTLWEMATREVPFADLTPMEAGMKIATEGLRVSVPPGISPHISKLVRICMNEDPGKRPSFDMILPILEKMCTQ